LRKNEKFLPISRDISDDNNLLFSAESYNSKSDKPLCEADLFAQQSGVPEGGDLDEPVAVPLGGLAELDVECFSCRGNHAAVLQNHLPGEGPGHIGDNGDPVAAAELDRIWSIHVYVGEHPEHL
jgi:hypothetical protein